MWRSEKFEDILLGYLSIYIFSTVLWIQPGHAQTTTDDLVFIHHSCGSGWLGNYLNSALIAKEYIDERNDIGYGTAMSSDAGRPASLGSVPGDNTNMNHWILWFNDYLGGVRSHGCETGENKIIMFKSCFPISNITGDGTEPGSPFSSTQTITNYKSVYRHPSGHGNTYSHGGYTYKPLEDIFSENPGTLFIAVTAPPRHYAPSDGTNDTEAHRARLFNNWLKNEWLADYNARHPGLDNVAVFDWFNVLAFFDGHETRPNRLKYKYGGAAGDSHPNDLGNSESTVIFADSEDNFLDPVWEDFLEPSVFARIRIFLEGSYDPDVNSMRTALSDAGLIPLQSPYADGRVVSAIPPQITDWILIQLRSADENIVSQRSFFLHSNGYAVDIDGSTTALEFPGVASGNYYITVIHRNHLSVMSNGLQSF